MTAKQRLKNVNSVIADIKQMMSQPSSLQMTSEQLKARADYRRELVGQIKSAGGKVNKDYE